VVYKEPLPTHQRAPRERHTLRRFALFESLPEDEIERLERHCLWRHFEAGSQILEHGDRSTEICFVAGGAVRVWLPTSRRTDIILADIAAGEFFGELAAIDGQSRSANVMALTATTVACLPAAAFHKVLNQHPSLYARLLRRLAGRIRVLNARVWEFSRLSVRDRVRAELLRLGRPSAGQPNRAIISPPPTHSELAARISAHREAVTRECRTLERNGLLERRRGALVLCDVAALADLVEQAQSPSELVEWVSS
jgi:CRP-like cAMP-binding protein